MVSMPLLVLVIHHVHFLLNYGHVLGHVNRHRNLLHDDMRYSDVVMLVDVFRHVHDVTLVHHVGNVMRHVLDRLLLATVTSTSDYPVKMVRGVRFPIICSTHFTSDLHLVLLLLISTIPYQHGRTPSST